ncbi:MAG: hypothetical protein KF705_09065 [Phycisphaeraceae bacterium]|nr:hypothetical protein [Phycisphaeraceae bacterium]
MHDIRVYGVTRDIVDEEDPMLTAFRVAFVAGVAAVGPAFAQTVPETDGTRVVTCWYKGVAGHLDVSRSLIWHLYNGTTVTSASGTALAAEFGMDLGAGICFDIPSVWFQSDTDAGQLGSVSASVPNASVNLTQTTHTVNTKGSFDYWTAIHHYPPHDIICEPGGAGILAEIGYTNSSSTREFSAPYWALIKHIGPFEINIGSYNHYPSECSLSSVPIVIGVWFASDEIYEVDTNDDEIPFIASHDMMILWSDGTVDRFGDVEDSAFDPVGSDPIVIEVEDEQFIIAQSNSENPTRVSHYSYQEFFCVIGNVDQDPDSTICWADRVALLSLPQVAIGQFGHASR